jgi:vitamin B12 transporter
MDHPDPDHDGYRTRSLSLHGGIQPTGALTLEANALRSEGHNAYDGDPAWDLPDNSDTVQQVVGGKVRYAPTARLAVQVTAGRNVDVSRNYQQDTFTDRFGSTRDSAGVQADIGVRAGDLLTLGVDWSRDRGEVDSPFARYRAARGDRAGFVLYQAHAGRHDLQASLRHDDNDLFGGHDTGGLAWGVDGAHGLRVTASVGTAFKAPTFNELYYPFFGNAALRPETSRSLEAGVQQRVGRGHWQLSAYDTTIHDLITYDTAIFAANNLDRARIRGVELTADASLAGWELSGQLGASDPRNRSADHPDQRLPRRARRSARLDADRAIGRWRVGGSWIAEGARFDDVANTLRVGGHATLDLRSEFAWRPDWTVQFALRNAFDRRYETAAYYNQPGREWSLALRWRPH